MPFARAPRARAIAKHGGKELTVLNSTMSRGTKLAILLEEVGEVAKVLNEYHLGNISGEEAKNQIIKELVDVGAVVALWMDAEDKRV